MKRWFGTMLVCVLCPTVGLLLNGEMARAEIVDSGTCGDNLTWTLDDEGFWRDSDGYYVVAASDIEHGETFTGSKGECKVYDCGCNEGVTDYYVNW